MYPTDKARTVLNGRLMAGCGAIENHMWRDSVMKGLS